MNNPEYILVDEFGKIVTAVKTALGLPVLNYQYGYVTELNATLKEWSAAPDYADKKFPLVWLAQPFSIYRGIPGYYGELRDIRIFIMNLSETQKKASARMTDNFKPVIYPIYRELIRQMDLSPVFPTMTADAIVHTVTDRYYYGEQQQAVLDDVIDCLEISSMITKISNKQDCTPLTNIK